jgi:hypothetical protein
VKQEDSETVLVLGGFNSDGFYKKQNGAEHGPPTEVKTLSQKWGFAGNYVHVQ